MNSPESSKHVPGSTAGQVGAAVPGSVTGTASITAIRGELRYLYDIAFDLPFKCTSAPGDGACVAAGVLKFSDVQNDVGGQYEVEVTWTGDQSRGALLTALHFSHSCHFKPSTSQTVAWTGDRPRGALLTALRAELGAAGAAARRVARVVAEGFEPVYHAQR
ncbi:hypothetical protein JKP88DRAFT_351308 [Tribonema minus]|uniref:Uncharacterized protein n=1 Tax=Tribonema minus TaxID=303371 RepID=A0A835YLV3_9STRA|nr:hypothetical protein JKP88DRAFT_351308 [Tribonema minus]